jgi:LPS sulfotransferase NodH
VQKIRLSSRHTKGKSAEKSLGVERTLTEATRWFVVIGARRTGTNLLREILNTNAGVAMLGEIFTPAAAPAHWPNFISSRRNLRLPPTDADRAAQLIRDYFRFIEFRIRNYWQASKKAHSHALGFDIKYDQLREIQPADHPSNALPFLLSYFRTHRVVLIHAIRENVIRCAISEMIAQQRDLWHNYNGATVDRGYYVDPHDCLGRARRIVHQRAEFERLSDGCRLVEARYEQVSEAIAEAKEGQISEDALPFREIARALEVASRFTHDGRLQRAINVSYSKAISNLSELRQAVATSEFSSFAATLE